MCHQARTSGSALSPSSSASSRRLPRVGAPIRAAAIASAGLRPSSPGPAGSSSAGAVSSGSAMAPSSHLDSVRSACIRPPLTASHGYAHARAALLGNPSDGFGGRTLALTIESMAAQVTLDAGSDTALIDAAIARFNRTSGASVPAAGPLRTTIPREVGLGGSSAIVIATLRALCAHTGFELAPDELAEMALAVEADDLGIAAGPQDRYVQAHGGLLYMDFAGGARCEPLDPGLLPPLFFAYAATPRAVVGRPRRPAVALRVRRPARPLAADRIADLAERGRAALLAGGPPSSAG